VLLNEALFFGELGWYETVVGCGSRVSDLKECKISGCDCVNVHYPAQQ